MAWIKVDERFFTCGETLRVGPIGALLYLEGLTYCMRFNLDELPRVWVELFWGRWYGEDVLATAVAELERAGMFVPGEDGWTLEHVWVEDEVVIEGPNEWGCAEVVSIARWNATECAYCGATEQLEVDHIVPRSRGGCSRPKNLQILCKPCNMRKRSTIPWGALGGGRRP